MEEIGFILLMFAIGALCLIADIFLPSHLVLTLAGLGFIGYAIYRTFGISTSAGVVATGANLVGIPILAYIAVKNWYRTPLGRILAPPNPDNSQSENDLERMIGSTGVCVSDLRPVGICTFEGVRLPCISRMGTIVAGSRVTCVGVSSSQLMVRIEESGDHRQR